MGTISSKAIDKVAGPSWDPLRPQFNFITELLLSVSPDVFADLTTIYIKFTLDNAPSSPVYAVLWVKTSRSLILGLSLPDGVGDWLGSAPKGMSYKGLTKYLIIEQGAEFPMELADLILKAFQHVKGS